MSRLEVPWLLSVLIDLEWYTPGVVRMTENLTWSWLGRSLKTWNFMVGALVGAPTMVRMKPGCWVFWPMVPPLLLLLLLPRTPGWGSFCSRSLLPRADFVSSWSLALRVMEGYGGLGMVGEGWGGLVKVREG